MAEDSKIDLILEKVMRLEKIEKAREIEGTLSGGGDQETESQMFYIGGGYRDITGEFDNLLTKTRFNDNSDVENTIEPLVQRFYTNLFCTRYGGCSIFVPVNELQEMREKEGDFGELNGFEIYPEEIEHPVTGEICYEIFIDIASVRTRAVLKGRFASLGGKARIEKIHDNSAGAGGQMYLDNHVPAPNLSMPPYKRKAGVPEATKAEVLADSVFEES